MSQRSRTERIKAEQVENLASYGQPSHPRGAGLYPVQLQPAVRRGDYVELADPGSIHRVLELQVQPGVKAFDSGTSDDVTVTANSTNSDNELNALEVPSNSIGQFRLIQPGSDIPADVEVEVDLGGSQAQAYITDNKRGFYTRETGTHEGYANGSPQPDTVHTHLTELYLVEDQDVYFTFTNTTAGDETVQNVVYSGYQYVISDPVDMADVPPNVTPVTWPNQPMGWV